MIRRIINSSGLFQNQHELSCSLRKDVNEINGVDALNDFNLSFLTCKNIRPVLQDEQYICSFFLISNYQFFRVFVTSFPIFFRDCFYFAKAISWEKNSFARIFDDLLKVESFKALLKIRPALRYVIFWENRGWQNYLALNYSSIVICIQLGYEGISGPIFMNHFSLRGRLNGKFFFATKFHSEIAHFKNSKLATLPSWRFNVDCFRERNLNHKNGKILLINSIDTSMAPYIIDKCNKIKNLYIRCHPENPINKFDDAKIDKRPIDKLLENYEIFLFTGSSSIILQLILMGAFCVRLVMDEGDNFDAYSSIIRDEIRLDEISKLLEGEFYFHENTFDYMKRDILGDVFVLEGSDLEV